jgi:hypothetical protein
MTSIADGSMHIQTSSESVPSTPSWSGEVVLMATHLRKHHVLAKISERVRFARRRFGHYEVIDFLAILFGYALSGERTLEADLTSGSSPLRSPSWPGRERDRLPARSTLSHFLVALTEAPVEALRTPFLDDLESRPLSNETPSGETGDLVDRAGNTWMVFDIDGTGEAASLRALPQTEDLLPAIRRLDDVCAPATGGASAAKSCVLAPSSVKPTVPNGSARLATEATVATAQSCARLLRRLRVTSQRTRSHKRVLCCGSTDNMAPGPWWQTWLVSPM